ncbi:hypothetical protein FA95DRAFT_1561720 [Auriscalpium vulgare]|uniref:Uncharacterized protein n=1 Tax=Auriscalpium vulgare TaxID=40419 RepID=A0ACB8RLF8_9AGAM|nr:hypothetical protein FA95DRAFT_1561720 [Auriscalpium vulgare]
MGEKGPLDLEKALIIGALLSDARTPLAAAVPTTSVYNARAHAHPAAAPPVRAPEPRQRTRQPFATPHAARPPTSQARPTQPPVQPRPRAPPRGPSPLAPPLTQPLVIPPLLGPHAPGYQSLRTARPAARESAPPLRNHHESHGESLEESFLQTLRQIDSEGASAGDTVVADLLSSYLPSPTFVAVPLSPPPALHVRRVAPEPAEDPEAPRVGGMYDAVARAIGAFRSG